MSQRDNLPEEPYGQSRYDSEYGAVNKLFLLRRGWTRTAIQRILGEPDRRIPRKRFRQDRPECRYDMARVLEAEQCCKVRFRKAPKRRAPIGDEFTAAGASTLTDAEMAQIEEGIRAKFRQDEEELRKQDELKHAAFLRQCLRDEG